MISLDDVRGVIGREVFGRDNKKIGKAGQVYLDDRTGQPEWVTISTGLLGKRETFVPLREATLRGDDLVVPYDTDTVKGAPNVDVDDGHLSEDQEAELYRYYSIDYDAGYAADRETVARDVTGAETDEAMTRSEERIRVGTERVQTGRARLRKWVETEDVTVTVPVTREKARLVTEPITDANRDAALSGPELSEEEHEVVLSEERPVVAKETVPVERVRVETETVQGEEQVSDSVRKERIAAEGDVEGVGRGVSDADVDRK